MTSCQWYSFTGDLHLGTRCCSWCCIKQNAFGNERYVFTPSCVKDDYVNVNENEGGRSNFNLEDWLDFSAIDELSISKILPPKDSYLSRSSHTTSTSLTISTTFSPKFDDPFWPLPDVVLIATDSAIFYVNQHLLLSASSNAFRGLLPILSEDKTKRVCFVQESASVLNTILHIFYGLYSSTECFPDTATLLIAVDQLPTYGISLQSWLQPSHPLYTLLISQAPLSPFDFYALAAHHEIEHLAVAVSAYTLQHPLWVVSEELTERMGSFYAMRLFRLHSERRSAFERSLMPPPPFHEVAHKCSIKTQNEMRYAWAEGVTSCLQRLLQQGMNSIFYLQVLHPNHGPGGDLSSYEILPIFEVAMGKISCQVCKKTKDDHLNKILVQKSLAKCTI